jgi:hypothetical protein
VNGDSFECFHHLSIAFELTYIFSLNLCVSAMSLDVVAVQDSIPSCEQYLHKYLTY